MTRKELIIEAGIDFTESHNPNVICGGSLYEQNRFLNRNKSFEEGAKWADNNLHWHKYPDEKPKPMQRVFVAYYHANIDRPLVNISKLIPSDKADPKCTCYLWSNLVNECDRVIAWIELPQPPKWL